MTDDLRGSCEAFEEGIPWEIWGGDHAHQVSVEGDGGKLYVAQPEEPNGLEEYVELYEFLTGNRPESAPEPVTS